MKYVGAQYKEHLIVRFENVNLSLYNIAERKSLRFKHNNKQMTNFRNFY